DDIYAVTSRTSCSEAVLVWRSIPTANAGTASQSHRPSEEVSVIGGKADMTGCGSPLSRSLLGVKRTWAGAVQMSAYDPKRTPSLTAVSRSDMLGVLA